LLSDFVSFSTCCTRVSMKSTQTGFPSSFITFAFRTSQVLSDSPPQSNPLIVKQLLWFHTEQRKNFTSKIFARSLVNQLHHYLHFDVWKSIENFKASIKKSLMPSNTENDFQVQVWLITDMSETKPPGTHSYSNVLTS
jgi:hypothetical protein